MRHAKQDSPVSKQDILNAINDFANSVEREFQNIKHHLSSQDGTLADHESKLLELSTTLYAVKAKVNSLPTKEYLDEKIGSMRGDLIATYFQR
ncbi:MAG: hypothetical protein HYV33_02270 [Candidatus Kerfeldbacteria bacterium]|nr:hypothetical protein [Candidatus Kerfeldbacteria bacterium]